MGNKISIDVSSERRTPFHVTSKLVSGERDDVLTRSSLGEMPRCWPSGSRLPGRTSQPCTLLMAPGPLLGRFTTLSGQFPRARFVTVPEVVPVIDETLDAKVAQWKSMYVDEVPDAPIGRRCLIVKQSTWKETSKASSTWAKATFAHFGFSPLSIILAGDLVYDETHV